MMINKEDFDTNTRPQDDFFHHIGGNWLKKNPIPDNENRWGTFNLLRDQVWQKAHQILLDLQKIDGPDNETKKIVDFYTSAIDPKQVEETGKPVLKEWVNKIHEATQKKDLFKIIGKLHANSMDVVWTYSIGLDEKNSTRYIFNLRQGGLGLPDKDYYEKPEMENFRSSYKRHIAEMLRVTNIYSDPESERVSEKIFWIENQLANASMSRTDLWHDIEAQYNVYNKQKLKELTSGIPWDEYFEALNSPVMEEFLVNQPNFFKRVNELFLSETIEDWQAYLSWHLLNLFTPGLGEDIEQKNFAFYGTILNGTKELQPRWKRVTIMIDRCLGEALGKKFTEKHFPPSAKQQVESMVGKLKQAFAKRIVSLDWMEEETKTKALNKLSKMQIKIGYPDKWRDYSDLHTENKCYINNILEAGRFEVKRLFDNLNKSVDRDEWHMTPPTVNAYAHFNLNEIVFPAGILQSPFFDQNATPAQNYGGIGTVIGHEITHGFDDVGSQFDENGNMLNWRTDQDKVSFEKKAEPLVKQADEFQVEENLFINGKLTLGENIADLGGVEIALDALEIELGRSSLDEERRDFFASYAISETTAIRPEKLKEQIISDPHSPSIFRVNGILANIDRFQMAFGIQEKDKMYKKPEDRVKIW